MKIAIFGFYNALNAGDDRIQYCLTRALRQGKENALYFLPHYMKPDPIYLSQFDWILIGGGCLVLERVGIWNRMRRWIGLSRWKISRSRKRVELGVLGLGVKQLPDGLDAELSDLLDRAKFFHVRDNASKQRLGNDARIQVWPDLVWMFPFRTTLTPEKDAIALNISPCKVDKPFDAALWIAQLEKERVLPFPLYFAANSDEGLLRSFYGDTVPDEWTLIPLERSEFALLSRYHALIFAMHLRRPFIAIKYDTKVEDLLTEAGLLDCMLEADQSEQLPAKLAWLRQNKASVIERIDAYASAQEARGKDLLEWIDETVRWKD